MRVSDKQVKELLSGGKEARNFNIAGKGSKFLKEMVKSYREHNRTLRAVIRQRDRTIKNNRERYAERVKEVKNLTLKVERRDERIKEYQEEVRLLKKAVDERPFILKEKKVVKVYNERIPPEIRKMKDYLEFFNSDRDMFKAYVQSVNTNRVLDKYGLIRNLRAFNTLMSIHVNGGSCRYRDMHDTNYNTLNNLKKEGFVSESKTRGSSKIYFLTPKGQECIECIIENLNRNINKKW